MKEEKMSNCPVCQKPILNCGDFSSPARFKIRCPWCQTTLQVSIRIRIAVEAVAPPAMCEKQIAVRDPK